MEPVNNTRDLWLQERMGGLGASDAPVVLGISPFQSRYALWSEKTGLAEPEDLSDSEAVEFGHRFETPVAEAFAARTGRTVEMWPAHTLIKHPERPWIRCTPDAVQESPHRSTPGTLQIKTSAQFNHKQWRHQPPLYVQVQCQQELFVTGFEWGSIAVCIGGQRLKWWDFERNDEFCEKLQPQLDEFWRAVLERRPPEVDGSDATTAVLQRLHPDDNGRTVPLPKEALSWTREIEDAREAIKRLEEHKAVYENRVRALIGDNTYGLLPDGRLWSWRTYDREGYSVAPGTVRTLRLGS